jgi:hypothetical protein
VLWLRVAHALTLCGVDDDEVTEQELSAEDVLTFGPVVEAVVWTPMWLQEVRAPIAVAAGKAKLGPIFNSDGIGKAVIIRPCISRGRRIRGLSPIYTPQMLEANAGVFDGWPMFMDHVPPELAEVMAKHGRSVKELGGQIVKGAWSRDFLHESDAEYGYQKGGVLAEIWATPFIRNTVGQNPNLLHTSINAWPKSGKPGPVPWKPKAKGMVIEGIRRQPQGSVDFVVRGGAGGRLLVQEGMEDEGAWPDTGAWSSEDVQLVVSVAESLYASRQMKDLPKNPAELKAYLEENAPHLLPALGTLTEADSEDKPLIEALVKKGKTRAQAEAIVKDSKDDRAQESATVTMEDVRTFVEALNEGAPSVEEFEERLTERAEEIIRERDEQRYLSTVAAQLIEAAPGLPASWKADLKARYSMLPSGPAPALMVEAETGDDGNEKSVEDVLKEAVTADLDHARNLIADAKGKPRVTGEGARKPDPAEGERSGKAQEGSKVPYWRERFASMGLSESADSAVEVYGGKVAKDKEEAE